MIGLPRGVSVYAFDEHCAMRKSLAYLFVSRDRERAKALYFDGTGMCPLAKRLEKGQFSAAWKRAKSKRGYEMTLSERSLFIREARRQRAWR